MATAATSTVTAIPEPQTNINTLLNQIPIHKTEVILTEFHKWYNEMNVDIRSLVQTNHPDQKYEFPTFPFFEKNKDKTLEFDNNKHTPLVFDFIWTYAGRYHEELMEHIRSVEDVKDVIDGDFEMGPAFSEKETQLFGDIFKLVKEDQDRFAKNQQVKSKKAAPVNNDSGLVKSPPVVGATSMKVEDSISTLFGSTRVDRNVLQDTDCKVAEGRYLW